jgi:hypothetical protein
MKLATKIDHIRDLVERDGLHEWSDLPDMMTKVARHRNLFAHRMFERNPVPIHYAQGIAYEERSAVELQDQEWEAFEASEVCRQLAERLHLAPLNPGVHFDRTNPVRPPRSESPRTEP